MTHVLPRCGSTKHRPDYYSGRVTLLSEIDIDTTRTLFSKNIHAFLIIIIIIIIINSMDYGTRRFNAAFTRALKIVPILSRINPIPRTDTYFLRSILILSTHLQLGLLKYLFPVGISTKILKALLPSSILATCPAHPNLLDLVILTISGER